MNKVLLTAIGGIVVVFVLAVAFSLLLALPTMWLWNSLMPSIFGLKHITFWQALGLNVLCSILFKSSESSSKKN